MVSRQQVYYQFLHSIPGTGPVALKHLLSCYPHVEAFWASADAPVVRRGRDSLNRALRDAWREGDSGDRWRQAIERQHLLARDGVHLLCWQEDDYPQLLKQAPDCPALLYVRGCPQTLLRPQLAIVGSRNAGAAGLATARDFAYALAGAGVAICSGLALGIDGAAHRGALNADGLTTAVLGTGIDVIYPQRHRQLASEICLNGALISEMPPHTPPRAGNFPRRNRIIAGLSMGTLVVEAALRSGSLITARLALDYNREVFAVPGSIHSPGYKGSHALIRDGAKLVESTEHILEEITSLAACHSVRPDASISRPSVEPPHVPGGAPGRQVLEAIDEHGVGMDEIVERTGLSAAHLAEVLLELELSGCIATNGVSWQRVLASGT